MLAEHVGSALSSCMPNASDKAKQTFAVGMHLVLAKRFDVRLELIVNLADLSYRVSYQAHIFVICRSGP